MSRPLRYHGQPNRHGRKVMKMATRRLVGRANLKDTPKAGFWPRGHHSQRA